MLTLIFMPGTDHVPRRIGHNFNVTIEATL
jgi:hypothetical protein